MPPKKEPNVTVPPGDKAAGKTIFEHYINFSRIVSIDKINFEQQCSSCHAIEQGDDKTAAAPSLGGVVGRNAGNGAFPYSNAMKKSGIVWTEKHLFAFIKAPAKYVAGTRMSFAGIGDDKQRADLIAYLAST